MIVDGKRMAEEIIAGLGDTLRGRTVGIVVGQEDPATLSFVKVKERMAQRLGVRMMRGTLPELLECDGIIIQLPHPEAEALLKKLPPEKDLDALGPGPHLVHPPVIEAISEIFIRNNVAARGKRAVVIGAGKLVGKPATAWLSSLGAHVSVITETHGSLEELHDADIVVSGAGEPGLITPQMLKQGVVLIDAGTSEAGGKLLGDADPACANIASVFTPVPGGIGPIAVAMIFKNLFTLANVR